MIAKQWTIVRRALTLGDIADAMKAQAAVAGGMRDYDLYFKMFQAWLEPTPTIDELRALTPEEAGHFDAKIALWIAELQTANKAKPIEETKE
jgi:hypothetical protein